ncbi:MAG: hypothetical protein ACOX9E_13815, partial [Lentisphaeria bacterium]
KTQAHAGANRAVGLQPAAAHDPANEKPKHTQAPTVLWACSPQHSRETGVLGAAGRTGNRCLSTMSTLSIADRLQLVQLHCWVSRLTYLFFPILLLILSMLYQETF